MTSGTDAYYTYIFVQILHNDCLVVGCFHHICLKIFGQQAFGPFYSLFVLARFVWPILICLGTWFQWFLHFWNPEWWVKATLVFTFGPSLLIFIFFGRQVSLLARLHCYWSKIFWNRLESISFPETRCFLNLGVAIRKGLFIKFILCTSQVYN